MDNTSATIRNILNKHRSSLRRVYNNKRKAGRTFKINLPQSAQPNKVVAVIRRQLTIAGIDASVTWKPARHWVGASVLVHVDC